MGSMVEWRFLRQFERRNSGGSSSKTIVVLEGRTRRHLGFGPEAYAVTVKDGIVQPLTYAQYLVALGRSF